jgi:hypothetical protein
MNEKTLVILEGQQHWVDNTIAQDDKLLRQVFTTLSPALANAEIVRTDTHIDLIPKKGTKGTSPLKILDAEPATVHPGIACCLALQQLELRIGINPNYAPKIADQIETAINQSKDWETHIKTTIKHLDQATNQSKILIGF